MSDCYIGFDQQYDLQFDVVQNKNELIQGDYEFDIHNKL